MVKRNAMRKNEEQIHVKNNNQKDKQDTKKFNKWIKKRKKSPTQSDKRM